MPNESEWSFRHTPATVALVGIAAIIEIVSTMAPDRRNQLYLDFFGVLSSIWQGELWRPFTTTLLHANLLHAGFNLYWVLRFAPVLERRFGSPALFGLVVLLGYVSTLPQFIVTNFHQPVEEQIPIVGLSGVLYGLLGILMIGRRWHEELNAVCDEHTEQFLLFWLVLCVFLTWQGLLPVANIAHAAGLAFGLVYGLLLFDPARRTRWAIVAAIATLAVLATLIAVPGHEGYEYSRQQREQQTL
ncbi:MAG: rhomboid family intramembrane serine protease [Thermoguttaceae bacterium]|nr:rhomboid family intramembrane serine protease [Thermoguttaceae bacterium]